MESATGPGAEAATTGSGDEAQKPRSVAKRYVPPRLEPGQTRAKAANEITELDDDYLAAIELMTYGLDNAGTIDGEHIPAHQPLTLTQAARALGLRLRRARDMMRECKAFQTKLGESVASRRLAERPRNLQTAVAIRDDEGDNTAADRTVRLKAIQSIEGTDRQGVNVTINNTNAQAAITPGYVIRIPEKRAARTDALQIEAEVVDVTPQTAP